MRNASHQNRNNAVRLYRAVFGLLCLIIFPAVTVGSLFWGFTTGRDVGGDRGMGYGILAVLISWYASMGSVFLGAIALALRERPAWPAIIGLSISLAPAALGLYLYLSRQF